MKKLINKKYISIAMFLVVFSVAIVYVFFQQYNTKSQITEIPYQEFMKKVEAGEVQQVFLNDQPELKGKFTNGEGFVTDNPRNSQLKEILLLKSIEVKEVNEQYTTSQIISFILLISVFGVLAVFLSRHSSKQTSKEYDKMSAVEYSSNNDKKISFVNVAGNQEAKDNLMEMVDFLKNPEKYEKYGARMPKGVILYGPPGTGKTLMAKALASEAGVDFMAVSGSDFVQIYAGVGAARIRSMFKKAKEKGKCVIFIDEIDAMGKKRDRGGMGGSDESDRTLNALLTEMSGFKGSEGIIVLAATNRLDTLDEALLRAGRFDRQIEVGLPDLNARKQILTLYCKDRPVAETIDINALAHQTVFFSGAKLENLMNEAAIFAAREDATVITQQHIDKAFYVVIAGEEKKDRSNIQDLDRSITAYHEAGHAVVTKLLCPSNRVTKVTIIPSTKGFGGFSMNIPADKMYQTKLDMLNNIKVALAGRIVEDIMFGSDNITTGASNDIQRSTEILVAMIKRFGMNEKIGMINYDVLLGHQGTDQRLIDICNEQMSKMFDETKELIEKHMDLVKEVAEKLLSQETINENEINHIYDEYLKRIA